MKQILLATALIVAPTLLFTTSYMALNQGSNSAASVAAVAVDPLGDLSSYQLLVDDISKSVASADWTTASTKATDLETKWDADQPTLQAQDGLAWGNVDTAIDAVLHSARAGTPDATQAASDLAALTVSLNNPNGDAGGSTGGVTQIAGINVTDANGHALPCESLLKEITAQLATVTLSTDIATQVGDLQTKATERCNADDDTRSDDFSAQALSLIKSAS